MHTPTDHEPSDVQPHGTTTEGEEAAAGAFRIRVNFTGLCLLVPQPAEDGNEQAVIHALLMNDGIGTAAHGPPGPGPIHEREQHADAHGAHAKHYAMLYVNGGHLSATSALTGCLVGIPLRDTVVRLPEGGTGIEHVEPLDAQVIPLHEITNIQGVPRACIGPKPGPWIAGRVVLTSGKQVEHTSLSRWNIVQPGAPGPAEDPWPATNEVGWEIPRVLGRHLDLELRNIDEDDRQPARGGHRLRLYPKPYPKLTAANPHAADRTIELFVCCLPANQLPGAPQPSPPAEGDEAEHFEGLFRIFPGVTPPKLLYTQDGATSEQELHAERGILTPYTKRCVAGQARLAPQEPTAP